MSKPRRSPRPRRGRRPIPPRARAPARWIRRTGVALSVGGGVLFLIGNLSARFGLVFLPFDRHHLLTQYGGGLVAAIGLLLLSSGTRRR